MPVSPEGETIPTAPAIEGFERPPESDDNPFLPASHLLAQSHKVHTRTEIEQMAGEA